MRERGKELAELKENFSSSMTLNKFSGNINYTKKDVKPKDGKPPSNKERKRHKTRELVSQY